MSTTEEERLRSLLFTTADEYKKTCEQRDALQSELRESHQSIESAQSEISRYKLQVEELREQITWLKRGDILHVLTDQELIDRYRHEREMQASIDALDRENDELREENARLRERMRTLVFCAYASSRDCDDCAVNGGAMQFKIDDTAICDGMRVLLRDVGIEVSK